MRIGTNIYGMETVVFCMLNIFKVAKSKAMVVSAELRQTKLASVLGRGLGTRCRHQTSHFTISSSKKPRGTNTRPGSFLSFIIQLIRHIFLFTHYFR